MFRTFHSQIPEDTDNKNKIKTITHTSAITLSTKCSAVIKYCADFRDAFS